jgi:mannose-6-phosphate isomerase-like protein (cupin superfamily)
MKVINVSNADHYVWGTGCDGWRLLNRSDLSVIQERIPPGMGEVRHYHANARQLFFVLKGRLEIENGNEIAQLDKGDSLEIHPTIPHRVRNPITKAQSFS